jgi:hypothetical protein
MWTDMKSHTRDGAIDVSQGTIEVIEGGIPLRKDHVRSAIAFPNLLAALTKRDVAADVQEQQERDKQNEFARDTHTPLTSSR